MNTLVSLSKLLYFIRNKLNKESYHSAEDIRKYKDAYKALYYLLSIEKANK